MNKGGIVSETHDATVQDTESVTTSDRIMKVKQKATEYGLTHSQIEYRRAKAQEHQNKINQSMRNKGNVYVYIISYKYFLKFSISKGKKEWKWKSNEQQKKKEALAKRKKDEEEKKKKARTERQGGGGGVVSSYAHFDDEIKALDPNRFKHLEKESDSPSTTTVKKTVVYKDTSYPIGSDDIGYYDKGQICSVWSQHKKEWVDGEVLEVIKFLKTIKIKFDGKTQQFRLPNTDMVRLKLQ